jgi:hypothetical protein
MSILKRRPVKPRKYDEEYMDFQMTKIRLVMPRSSELFEMALLYLP